MLDYMADARQRLGKAVAGSVIPSSWTSTHLYAQRSLKVFKRSSNEVGLKGYGMSWPLWQLSTYMTYMGLYGCSIVTHTDSQTISVLKLVHLV